MKNLPLHHISFLLLRILGSLIFIHAGLNHLLYTDAVAGRLTGAAHAPWALALATPSTLVIGAGFGLLAGGLALLLGFRTRLAAAGLLLILLPITWTVQVGNPAGAGPLFKNIALAGILLFYLINGAGYYGLDQLVGRRLAMGLRLILVLPVLALSTARSGATAGGELAAVTADTSHTDYAVLVSQPDHLKAALHTARTMTAEAPYYRQRFVVMACGKSVEAFVTGHALQATIEEGRRAGITYRLCGLSLDKFQIDRSRLPADTEIIPNGLTHMFDLKREGFITVEL